jgi:hypothetical protein
MSGENVTGACYLVLYVKWQPSARWNCCRILLSCSVSKMAAMSGENVAGTSYMVWFGKWRPSQLKISQGPVIWFGMENGRHVRLKCEGTC